MIDPVSDSLISATITGLVTGAVAGAVAWSAIRVEIHYLRRDVDRLFSLVRDIERRRMEREG